MKLNKFFKITFLSILILEFFSLAFYLNPLAFKILFVFVLLGAFVLTFYNLEYGIYILFAEVFISSKGYLFFWDFGDFKLSIRIALWLVIMSVFLARFLGTKKKKEFFALFKNNKTYALYLALFVFVFWGALNALLNKNSIGTCFFDLNAWFFFLLLAPLLLLQTQEIWNKKVFLNNVLNIFWASLLWVSFKTLGLFYIFTHNISPLNSYVYKWVRDTGVGEITAMNNGFSRIFFQSHVFVIAGMFLSLFLLAFLLQRYSFAQNLKSKKFIFYFLSFVLFLAVNLISFSRSNWLGAFLAFVLSFFVLIFLVKAKGALKTFFLFILALLASLALVAFILKFPYPSKIGNPNAIDVISERASQVKNEAGVSSRWALLPKLLARIQENPVLGKGFGTLITYKSSDPRVLAHNPSGMYTTYAFEWGWLDIWLKIGLFGLVLYLWLLWTLFSNFYQKYKKNKHLLTEVFFIKTALLVSLFALIVINFFSPYFNHPIGITYLLILSVAL